MKTNSYELSLLEAQQRIHELIAQQAPLPVTLTAIADLINSRIPGARVSIMRYDPKTHTLSMVKNPNFSSTYIECMQNIPVREDIGTCGKAAFLRQTVITENILKDPNWKDYLEHAKREDLMSCWSVPIITGADDLLGTFATYYRQPTVPNNDDLRCLAQGAGLACLALIRHREALDHQVLSEWHKALFYNHPDGVFTLGLDGKMLSCNSSFEAMGGFTRAQIIGHHFKEFVADESLTLTLESFEKSCQGQSVMYELRGKHSKGHYYDIEVHNFPVIIDQQILGVYGICRDITERKLNESELRLLKRATEVSPHGIVILDALNPKLPAVYANPAFTQITQYSIDDILGKPCPLLDGPDTDQSTLAQIQQEMKLHNEVDVVLQCYRKNGATFWNHMLIRPVFSVDSRCTHFLIIQQDVSEQRRQDERIQFQRTHDLSTGLPNQAVLYTSLQKSHSDSIKQATNLAVLYLDLDDFQPINDELGHQIGNQVLAIAGQRLSAILDTGQLLARMAGDEFCILYPGYQHPKEIQSLANLILEHLARPIEIDTHRIHISASIGIASLSDSELLTVHELMKHAIKGVEKAKRQGRNTWQWHKEHRLQRSSHGVTLRQEIHEALNQSQFELFYQPVIDAKDHQIHSVEALIRWKHPKRGLVTPGEFIQVAEQTGQIIPLGQWVLQQACQDIVHFNRKYKKNLSVAVNISSLQFYRDSFLDDVKAVLHQSDLNPRLLELEVTESVLLDGTQRVIDVMQAIQTLGSHIAIDDFGTGFSSLSYLGDLPAHKLKLDRRFVQKVSIDKRIEAIVEAIISMAHRMDMTVVAEGIETEQQRKELMIRGCDQLQGYFFARPMPLSELTSFEMLDIA